MLPKPPKWQGSRRFWSHEPKRHDAIDVLLDDGGLAPRRLLRLSDTRLVAHDELS